MGSEELQGRFILVNPFTQEMIVMEAGTRGYSSVDALLREYLSFHKEGEPPASSASIEALPTVEMGGGGECAICLEEWRVGEVGKEMPCMHRFHGECVDKWLKIHGSCPLCRFRLPAEDGGDGSKPVGGPAAVTAGGGGGRDIWVSFSFARDGRPSVEVDNNRAGF